MAEPKPPIIDDPLNARGAGARYRGVLKSVPVEALVSELMDRVDAGVVYLVNRSARPIMERGGGNTMFALSATLAESHGLAVQLPQIIKERIDNIVEREIQHDREKN